VGPELQREKGTGPGCQRRRGGEGARAAGLVAGLRGGQLGRISGPGEEEARKRGGWLGLSASRPSPRFFFFKFFSVFFSQFLFPKKL